MSIQCVELGAFAATKICLACHMMQHTTAAELANQPIHCSLANQQACFMPQVPIMRLASLSVLLLAAAMSASAARQLKAADKGG